MVKTPNFKKTPRQVEAINVLSGPARHNMLYGGSRSGKTFILCYAVIVRAMLAPNSRHLICRLHFNHAKTALWLDTFPKVFSVCFPDLTVKENATDYYYTMPNGSEVWVAGLDDKQRTEKILGKEYSTIYFNECSQIPFSSISLALTRLAQKSEITKKAYYDENPPSKRHWSYAQFILGRNPEDWAELDQTKYSAMLMNPMDNQENIDEDYISEILEELPEKQRRRFMHGEFVDDDSGLIYYAFDRENNVKNLEIMPGQPIWIGMDFNINPMTATVCQVYDNSVFVLDEIYLMSSNTGEMAEVIKQKYGHGHRIVPDSTGKRKQTSSSGFSDHDILRQNGFLVVDSTNPFRMDRYNTINSLFEKKRIYVDPKCQKLIKDLQQVSYKEGTSMPDTAKDSSLTHISDALGYLVYYHFPITSSRGGISMLPR